MLSYHQTATPPRRGTPVRSLVLPPWRFALQLRTLKLLGWQGLSMRDLEPYLHGEKTGKVFGITLDDGYLNNLENALPVLRELGFTATAFIVSGQVGGTNAWDHPVGAPAVPLMDVDDLRTWLDAGMEIGAHTRNHVNLCATDEVVAREEIAGSKHDLEQLLGIEVRSFCYPYGEHRAEHADMVRQAGYATATAIVSSRTRAGDDLMRLPRISVHLYDKLPSFLARVTTDYEDWRMRQWNTQPTSRGYYLLGGEGPHASAH
ncbi:polysaccharide deacetylase family protein [Ramlibacter sp. Leaf400]|uniref:polysaccharide deacetylase family protein n=1 Tax=Ramlibacter sp. Leaf400 TaxID=1736365 RepID=UPI001F2B0134|nr:polysaccharide deacetylase family protein [Ramlibacter sp. Leaf400]